MHDSICIRSLANQIQREHGGCQGLEEDERGFLFEKTKPSETDGGVGRST